MENEQFIGYACAYTPLALMHASGFTPYRILPVGDAPDQAGRLLHDNLCPHVKRILDRAMSGDLPKLAGMVFMNSCDAMRRLKDAWASVCPGVESVLIDLPSAVSERDARFLKGELERLNEILRKWSGKAVDPDRLQESIGQYNRMGELFGRLRKKAAEGSLPGGARALQEAYRRASVTAPETMLPELKKLVEKNDTGAEADGVPVYLFGNMMPETEAFALISSCGARITGEDLCTGSRLFSTVPAGDDHPQDLLRSYAEGLLNRPACARTMTASDPGQLARDVAAAAMEHRARGVIGYTVKFCDPYIARIPGIRKALKEAGIPFLMLEGDCTVRTMGQQKTRIEAFIEMLR